MTQQHLKRHWVKYLYRPIWLHKAFSNKVRCYDKCYGQCYFPFEKEGILTNFYRSLLCLYVGIEIWYKVIKISSNIYQHVCNKILFSKKRISLLLFLYGYDYKKVDSAITWYDLTYRWLIIKGVIIKEFIQNESWFQNYVFFRNMHFLLFLFCLFA